MKMIIGGQKVEASDGAVQEVVNPATHAVVDTVPMATKDDMDLALSNARKGFSAWSKIPLHKRIETLYAFEQLFKEAREDFIRLGMQEMGKTRALAAGEITVATLLIRNFCEAARSLGGETFAPGNHPIVEKDLVLTVREPWGVVLCLLPFNSPISLYVQKAIPALLMGNAVIVKPASDTPLCNIMMTELLLKSGIEPDAVQIITGSGSKVGKYIVSSKDIDVVSLTGSTEVGIQIAKDCAEHLHRVSLELGGNDALIILEDADMDLAIDESFCGRHVHGGQICCASKRFIVQNSIREEFTNRLLEKIKAIKVGDPNDESTTFGPVNSEKAAIDVERQIQHTLSQGAHLLFGGKRFNRTYIEPTLLTDVTPDMDIARDMEIFGPVWPIIGFDTMEEAIDIANNSIYGLSSGVITRDQGKAMQIARALQAGCCVFNGSGLYRSADQPFGGYKMSGIGREGGRFTLEEMSQLKTLVFKNQY
ncbi:MAG: aldehyde dehydrogenase family protein [Opitutae bacterium]|nr:aldehyde dehydrogenase family protein [Opitutae bacterium]